MSLIVLEKVGKAYQGEAVLREADLVLNQGDKVGLVGRNGCGKTTLLGIAAGVVTPDSGSRSVTGKPRWGMLTQAADFGAAKTVLEAGSAALEEIDGIEKEMDRLADAMEQADHDSPELDRLIKRRVRLEERFLLIGGYRSPGKVEAVLRGVGFKRDDFSKDPRHLSGGESKRLQLAMVLLGGHEILFLDEPGNHLDLAGTQWLTEFLIDYQGTVLLVSHDRYLLNGVTNKTVQLTDGYTYFYGGNYDFFLEEYPLRAEAAEKKKEQQDKLIAKGEEYIRRNFYGQKARQAKSKRKMLGRLEEVRSFRPEEKVKIAFKEAALSGEGIVRLEQLGASIEEKMLFQRLDLDLVMGETLGIIGPNGCGKTSLIRILLGQLEADTGTCWLAPFARPIYFDQQLRGLKGLQPGEETVTLLDELRLTSPTSTDGDLRYHLARFLFKGDDVHKPVSTLSGGEQSKALMAKITLSGCNLLILDEPTNHLDLFARESLEAALSAFQGTTIIVSHDRRLLDGIVDKLLILGEKKPALHWGNYSSYAEKLKAAREEAAARKATGKTRPPPSRKSKALEKRVKRRHTYEDLEQLIISNENRLQEIEVEIYKEEVYMDRERSEKLAAETEQLKKDLKALYEEWETWT